MASISDAAFSPTDEDVDDINAIRERNGLCSVSRESIKTVGDWRRVCDENDAVAERNVANFDYGAGAYGDEYGPDETGDY